MLSLTGNAQLQNKQGILQKYELKNKYFPNTSVHFFSKIFLKPVLEVGLTTYLGALGIL